MSNASCWGSRCGVGFNAHPSATVAGLESPFFWEPALILNRRGLEAHLLHVETISLRPRWRRDGAEFMKNPFDLDRVTAACRLESRTRRREFPS
jgi:hypothetical protein